MTDPQHIARLADHIEPDYPPALGVFLIAALCFWAGLFLGAIVAIFAGWVV